MKEQKAPPPEILIKAIRESFIGSEQVYMNGSCIMFFKVLQTVFPDAMPYWNAESKHMITKIGPRFYDITGEVIKPIGYKLDDGEYGSLPIAVAFPQEIEQRKRYHNLKKFF